MQRLFIVDRDFIARMDVAQSEEHYVAIDGAHVGVRLAGMVDVMRTIAAATAVDAPLAVNIADAQLRPMCAALCFAIGNSFSGVLRDLAPVFEMNCREAAFAVDR